MTSSAQFKDAIKPTDRASKALFALSVVAFRYKKQIDPAGISQFGLVAKDVEKVNPDLILRDAEGKPETIRDEQINAMLLDRFFGVIAISELDSSPSYPTANAIINLTKKEKGKP
jgi:hypothetical protein